MRPPCRRREHRWRVAAQAALPAEPPQNRQENEPLRSRFLRLAKHLYHTHLSITDGCTGCDPNRKQSKFECNGLFTSGMARGV